MATIRRQRAQSASPTPTPTPAPGTLGWTPIPDPTTLTSNAVSAAKDELRREIEYVEKQVDLRLESLDKAAVLLQAWREHVPVLIAEAIAHQRDLFDQRFQTVQEQFNSIQTQFIEKDARSEQTSRDAKVAIDAALTAQSLSVTKQNEANAVATAKAEDAFSRQIEQQRLLLDTTSHSLNDKIDTTVRSINDKIDDLKELVLRGEGRGTGMKDSWGIVLAIIGAAGVLYAMLKH
jgi:hypothetical protein